MAVHSNVFGSVKVSGEDAKALTRRLVHGRGTRASVAAAQNGRKLATIFSKSGSVPVKLARTN